MENVIYTNGNSGIYNADLNKIDMEKANKLKRKMMQNLDNKQAEQTQAEENPKENINMTDGDIKQLKTTKIPTELQEYFNDNDDITESTKLTYLYDYLRLKSLLGTKTHISNLPQKKVLEAIQNTDKAKRPLINIAIILFNYKDKQHTRLITYREELFNDMKNNQKTKNKKILENANTSYEDLMDALKRAKKDDYILFYLLINYNLRNLDLISRLVINTDELENKDEENYILYGIDEATFYINDYKTKTSYGTKKFKITDDKFLKILHNKYEDGDEYLFINRTGKPYKQNEMGKYIKSRFKQYLPLSNLSQSTIFKIIHNENKTNNDHEALRKMSKNRGQLMDTADNMYSSIENNDDF